MRVLVTGGAGFIGSHIVEHLLEDGHAAVVMDDLSAGFAHNVASSAEFHRLSILQRDLERVLTGVDAIVHAAAQTSVSASVCEPAADALINVFGTVQVLDAARRAGVKRFIFLSSAAVYGSDGSPPYRESSPVAPASPYGLSKFAGEQYVRLLTGGAMAGIIFRLANVYGPRQNAAGEAGVIARWCDRLASGNPVILHGDGSQTRDFIYVGDVARAVALAVRCPGAPGETLNLGTGLPTAIRDVLQELERRAGRPAQIERAEPRAGDLQHSALDSARARTVLGWAPETPLADGLAATFAWVKEQREERGIEPA